jgi:hypothetical protein
MNIQEFNFQMKQINNAIDSHDENLILEDDIYYYTRLNNLNGQVLINHRYWYAKARALGYDHILALKYADRNKNIRLDF